MVRMAINFHDQKDYWYLPIVDAFAKIEKKEQYYQRRREFPVTSALLLYVM